MKYLKTLLKLLEFGELNYSSVPKTLIQKLQNEALIEIKIISANKKRVIVKEHFYKVYKDIKNIKDANTRSELVKVSNHSKTKRLSPQDGLYLNGNCTIDEVKLPLFNNSAIFLKEFPRLNKNTLVICVENYENLIYFKTQLKYFQEEDIVFIFRNSAMLKFITNIENKIIYFGDFDLAGIFIYETQIVPRGEKIEFFIPKDIENIIIKNGSNELYKNQYEKFKNLKSQNKNIQNLIDMINKYQKTIEQEYFI